MVSAHSEGMEVASTGTRGEEDTKGHPCRLQSTCAGRMECGVGKDRQKQAARAPKAPRVSACTPLLLQVAGTKGPGSPGSRKTA